MPTGEQGGFSLSWEGLQITRGPSHMVRYIPHGLV